MSRPVSLVILRRLALNSGDADLSSRYVLIVLRSIGVPALEPGPAAVGGPANLPIY